MGGFSLSHWLIFVILVSPIVVGVLLLGLQKPVRIVHADSGLVKTGYIGYSWTYLLFGWFVPLVRGELGVAALHLVITIVSAGLSRPACASARPRGARRAWGVPWPPSAWSRAWRPKCAFLR